MDKEKKKGNFKEKWKNFWSKASEHTFKIAFIVIVLALFMSCCSNCTNKRNADFKIQKLENVNDTLRDSVNVLTLDLNKMHDSLVISNIEKNIIMKNNVEVEQMRSFIRTQSVDIKKMIENNGNSVKNTVTTSKNEILQAVNDKKNKR